MAGPRVCRILFPPANKDELAKKAHIKGSGISTLTSIAFRALTFTFAPAFASVLGLLGRYTDENL